MNSQKPPKLILTVIDGMKPTMVERAMKSGSAPALKAIADRGHYVPDCCAAFPSVTPVCIATDPAEHYYESVGRTWEREPRSAGVG